MLRKMSRGVHDVDHGGVKGAVYRYKAADQEQATLAPHALREPAQSKCIWTSHKSSFMRTLAGKKRTRNTHGHVSRAMVRGKLTGKRPQTKSLPNSPGRLCASLRNQNTYGHVTKAIFDLLYDTSKKKGQEPRASTSIKHRPSLLPYETLSVGTLMGKKEGPATYDDHQQPIPGPHQPLLLFMLLPFCTPTVKLWQHPTG